MATPFKDPRGKTPMKAYQGQATPNKRKQVHPFENYLSLEEVQQGLKRGELVEGILRINPKSYEDAYISAPDGQMDIYIGGILDRNRAMNGDQVVVQVKDQSQWKVLNDAFVNQMKNQNRESEISDFEVSDKENKSECDVNVQENLNREVNKTNAEKAKHSNTSSNEYTKPPNDKAWKESQHDNKPHSLETATGSQNIKKKRNKRTPKKNVKINTDYNVQPTEKSKEPLENESVETLKIDTWSPTDIGWDRPPVSQVPWCNTNDYAGFVPGQTWGLDTACNTPGDVVVLSATAIQHLKDYKEQQKQELCNSIPPPVGIAVAPDQLTDLEFSDSISETSTGSNDLSEVLEDSEFINSQLSRLPATGSELGPGQSLDDLNNKSQCLPINNDKQDSTSSIHLDVDSLSINDNKNNKELKNKRRKRKHLNKKKVDKTVSCPSESDVHEVVASSHSEENKSGHVPTKQNASSKTVKSSKSNNLPVQRNTNSQTPPKNSARSNTADKKPDSNNKLKKKFDVGKVLKEPYSSRFVQKTGKVVYISREIHPRVAAGHIQPMQDKNPDLILFCPRDHRVPRLMVPSVDCPGFNQHPERFKNVLFLARMTSWENTGFARGNLCQMLGVDGNLQGETIAILIENGVDFSEFPENVYEGIPDPDTWSIPQSEIDARRDLRSICIFTIDPATTRDIDDAMSCDRLPDGRFRVGVHIADVSYFVKETTHLDKFAADRATSVYLIHQVIPMLPRALCNQLCSLNPSTERLTFSVEWVLNEKGEVLEEWFGRTIIKSCSKLSYEHAQEMIDHQDKSWQSSEMPEVSDGFTIDDVAKRVQQLNSMAVCLRRARFNGGALRLDQVKLTYDIDPETGLPQGFDKYEHSESHRLIEEFMLLANMAVARKIYSSFTNLAVLRCHPEPQSKPFDDVIELCEAMGLPIDGSSAGSLHKSLSQYAGSQELANARFQVLTHLCTKPMKLARYFCTGWIKEEELFRHYALNVPLYTHFTSPIRRYPDIMVHRQLAAALGYCELKDKLVANLHQQAEHCNDKKTAAKRAQEQSGELYLALYIQLRGPFIERAMVVSVLDKAVDLLILRMGVIKRAYTDKLPLRELKFENLRNINRLTLTWEGSPPIVQPITVFTLVHVLVEGANEPLKFNVILQGPGSKQQ